MDNNTVPVTVARRAVTQEPAFFAWNRIILSSLGRSCICYANLISLTLSCAFYLSLRSSLTNMVWLVVEKLMVSVTVLTNSTLIRFEVSNVLCTDITIFWRPSPDFLTSIALKDPTMGAKGVGGGSHIH